MTTFYEAYTALDEIRRNPNETYEHLVDRFASVKSCLKEQRDELIDLRDRVKRAEDAVSKVRAIIAETNKVEPARGAVAWEIPKGYFIDGGIDRYIILRQGGYTDDTLISTGWLVLVPKPQPPAGYEFNPRGSEFATYAKYLAAGWTNKEMIEYGQLVPTMITARMPDSMVVHMPPVLDPNCSCAACARKRAAK